MRRLLFTLLLLAAPLALAATVYKWVDENGVVHYSDQPHPNAEKVHVKEPQTYRESNPLAAPAAPSPDGGGGGGPTYRGCLIAQPADNEDLANPDSLVVVVRTDPPLRPGDQVFVTLDGQALNDGRPTGAQFTISPVERGTHVLQATVRDSGGALLCQTSGISYSAHQPSVLNPANPVRPR